MPRPQVSISVNELTQVGEARRHAMLLSEECGFSAVFRGQIAIVVTELATNLVRYATQGEILLRAWCSPENAGSIELLSIDRGPGISDLALSMTDGYSTGGNTGNGLGAIQRICSVMDVYTSVPQGTVIYCRLDSQATERGWVPELTAPGIVNLAAPRELMSGDSWRFAQRDHLLAALIVDGLGHGPLAADAAAEATRVFDDEPFAVPAQMLTNCHKRMQGTRGGAIAIAQVDQRTGQMRYAGVGNISGILQGPVGGNRQGLLSHNGTVGLLAPRIQEFAYKYVGTHLLILHSDGLQTRWSLDSYPGLYHRHPGVIAGTLYRDFCRGRDDVTVLVMRLSNSGMSN